MTRLLSHFDPARLPGRTLLASASLLTAFPVFASSHVDAHLDALQSEIQWLQAETLVSTATKTTESIAKSGSTVSVITVAELKAMGARNLNDALKRIPGLGVSQFNIGMPAVEVRGVKTDFGEKVLYLINGHPANTNIVNGGGTWVYENFIVDEIKQVEVVRGPGSALYGADAFVGVINIITRKAKDAEGVTVTAGGGSDNTGKLNLQVGHIRDDLNVAFNANVIDSNGFEGHIASDALGQSGKMDTWGRRYDIALNVQYQGVIFQSKYVDRTGGSYAGVANALNTGTEQNYIDYFFELGYRTGLTSQLQMQAKVYFDHFGADNLWQFFPPSEAFPEGVLGRTPGKINRSALELQFEQTFSDRNKLLLGMTLEHQKLFDVGFFNNYDPFTGAPTGVYEDVSDKWNWNGTQKRDITAVFLQDIWDVTEALRLIIGARYDHYDDFGGTFNPRSSLTYEFINNHNLVLTYGSAFRAPSFGELYNKNNPSVLGNPDVQPEEIDTIEIGVTGDVSRRISYRITGFQNNITDLIAPVATQSAVSVSGNVGKLKVEGVELEASYRLGTGSVVQGNYTYQNPKNELTGERVPNVSRQKLNLAFTYRHSRALSAYLGINYRGALARASGDPRSEVPSYVTGDVAVNWQSPSEQWQVTGSVYNITDKDYVDASPLGVMESDYPKPGRNFMLEVAFKI